MALSEDRLDEILDSKDVDRAEYGEGWYALDGAIIIYDTEGDPPDWLPEIDSYDYAAVVTYAHNER